MKITPPYTFTFPCYLVIVCQTGRDSDIEQSLTKAGINLPVLTLLDEQNSYDLFNLQFVQSILVHSGGGSWRDRDAIGTFLTMMIEQYQVSLLLTQFACLQGYDFGNTFPDKYYPMHAVEYEFVHTNLGKVVEPNHPILTGIHNVANYVLTKATVRPNAQVIANYQHGQLFIAEQRITPKQSILALNMVGASKKHFSNFWCPDSTDCPALLKNCLHYLASQHRVPWQSRLFPIRSAYTDIIFELQQ